MSMQYYFAFFLLWIVQVTSQEPNIKLFTAPKIPNDAYMAKYFSVSEKLDDNFIISVATDEKNKLRYDGDWSIEEPRFASLSGDYALLMKTKAKHYGLSAKFRRPFWFSKKDQLVVQYEVKFEEALDCGGAYVKLLSHSPHLDLKKFDDKTPFTIMFGPDKCGNDLKLHFIFRIMNPLTGKMEEKQTVVPDKKYIDRMFKDNRTHLYTLVMSSDNTYAVYLDQSSLFYGSMLYDVVPPMSPEKDMDDPAAVRPTDWDDRTQIPDPDAVKPADWDESQPKKIPDPDISMPEGWLLNVPPTIDDPSVQRPSDWNEGTQGKWKPPQLDNPLCKEAPGCGPWKPRKIRNPLYKGKWSAPMITNPNYQGTWKPNRIPNPYYEQQMNPFRHLEPVSAIGMELWSMTENVVFDNFLVIDNKDAADEFAKETWANKLYEEIRNLGDSQSVVDAVKYATEERPWLWIIIIGSFVVPIGLFFYWLFKPSGDYSGFGPRYHRAYRDKLEAQKKNDDLAAAEQLQNISTSQNGHQKGDTPSEDNNLSEEKPNGDSTTRKRVTKKD